MSDPAQTHDVFQAVADHTRREILRILVDEPMSITAIVEHFPITRTAVNKHLHILSDAGLVQSRRVGRETRYYLQPGPLYELHEWVSFYEQYWDHKLEALQKYVESEDEP
jgi:DNA-binding transcriptional ArsR family regulator